MIEYYDNPETAPFKRYQRFNSILAQKMQTGDNVNDFYSRIDRSIGYIGAGDKTSAINELSNLKMAVNYVKNSINLEALAYATMIKSIDGQPCNDISFDGLQKTLDKCNELGVSIEDIRNNNIQVKKKSPTIFKRILKIFS